MKKMAKYTLLFWFCILSCNYNSKSNSISLYPSLINELGIQSYYDIAVREMYKINTCCNCNCMAIGLSKYGKDTLNIIELDLKMKSLVKKNDTLTFVFVFYSIIESDTVNYTPFSSSWTTCLYNGISFKGVDTTPFPISYGDVRINHLSENFYAEADINFEHCLKNKKVNFTLKRLLDKK